MAQNGNVEDNIVVGEVISSEDSDPTLADKVKRKVAAEAKGYVIDETTLSEGNPWTFRIGLLNMGLAPIFLCAYFFSTFALESPKFLPLILLFMVFHMVQFALSGLVLATCVVRKRLAKHGLQYLNLAPPIPRMAAGFYLNRVVDAKLGLLYTFNVLAVVGTVLFAVITWYVAF